MEETVRRSGGIPRALHLVVALLALIGTACESGNQPTRPSLPARIPASEFIPLAFTAIVDVRAGDVTITAPHASGDAQPTLSRSGRDGEAPSLSLLGGDALRIIPTKYTSSQPGAFAPNKIRVTFDVTIENKLPYVSLTTPTWPQPPATGVILFPLDYRVGSGAPDTLFVPPRADGMIVPSVDWNGTGASGSGAPFNFFNEEGCAGATTDDCFRWLAFEDRIFPTSRSVTRTVGFDIDDTVAVFSARLIVAGDLSAVPPPIGSAITGLVSSSLGGVLAGVGVTVTTGHADTTNAFGLYTIAGLPPGAQTVSASLLPGGCTPPPSQSVNLAAGDTVTVDLVVTCTTPTGILLGTLTSSLDGSVIAGATVVASTGGSAVTNASGAFLIPAAGAGTGSLTVSGLVATCTVAPTPFTLVNAGTTTVNLVATCAPPAGPGGS
jgi:hypothetical protein